MFKNIAKFEFIVADRVYHFLCDHDSPIDHVKEVIFQLQKMVGQIEDNAKAQLKESEKQEKPKSEEVVDVEPSA